MDRAELELNVLRNALYHQGQRRRLERLTRWSNFLVIMLGASAMGDLTRLAGYEGWAPAIGAATAAVGALQLVFDFGGRARDHQVLQRDYYNLFAEIDALPKMKPEDIARLCAAMTRIVGGEPAPKRAVEAKAHNDALSGLGHWPEESRVHIPFLHRLFGQQISFEGYQYKTLAEIAAAKAERLARLEGGRAALPLKRDV